MVALKITYVYPVTQVKFMWLKDWSIEHKDGWYSYYNQPQYKPYFLLSFEVSGMDEVQNVEKLNSDELERRTTLCT
jgi:hypothetical protein